MARTTRSYRLPDITLRQLEDLAGQTGLNHTEIIRSAVDRMHQQEQEKTKMAKWELTSEWKDEKTTDWVVSKNGEEVGRCGYWPDSPKSCEAAERTVVEIMRRNGATDKEMDSAFMAETY